REVERGYRAHVARVGLEGLGLRDPREGDGTAKAHVPAEEHGRAGDARGVPEYGVEVRPPEVAQHRLGDGNVPRAARGRAGRHGVDLARPGPEDVRRALLHALDV